MPENMGKIDRIVRIVLAVLVGVLYFTKQLSGTAAIVLGIVSVILLVTSIIGFCPLYLPFKWSTKKV